MSAAGAAALTPDAVSVVVQGAIAKGGANGLTGRCLQSVRRNLPGAEIILSTYAGSDINGLTYDVLVESDDPGGQIFTRADYPAQWNNVNRQIVTTQAGLARATRPYAVKLRNDVLVHGDGFLSFFGKFRDHKPSAMSSRVFEERVLTCTMYSRNPRRIGPFAFHPSDWFFFGKTSDVQKLFDIPLAPEPETSRWFESFAPRPDPDGYVNVLYRWSPEQYIWLACLKKHVPDAFQPCEMPDHHWEVSEAIIHASERSMAENFVVLTPRQLQIEFVKYKTTRSDWASVYTHGEWLRLYRTYCFNAEDAASLPEVPRDREAEAKWAFVHTLTPPDDAPVRGVLRLVRRMVPFNLYEKCWATYRRLLG